MKTPRLLFALSVVLFAITVSCIHNNRLQTSHLKTINQPVKVVWIEKKHEKNPLKYYEREIPSEKTINCDVECHLDNDMYQFLVVSKTDTVSFSISKYYIGTNIDSINIVITESIDTSSIYVFPYCSWAMHERWFVKGTPLKDYCHIASTCPVHVAIFVLVDVMKDNHQQSIYEILKQDRMMKDTERLDSIIQSLPDPDNDASE